MAARATQTATSLMVGGALCCAWASPAAAQSAASLMVLREADALSCPGHDALVARVETLLERPFGAVTQDPVTLLVHFKRTPSGLEAVVTMSGARKGIRRIQTDAQPGSAGECEELGGAAALAISMLLDPTLSPVDDPLPDSPYDTMQGDDFPASPYPAVAPDLSPVLIAPPLPAAGPLPGAEDEGRRLPLQTPDWYFGLGPAESDGLVGRQVFGVGASLGIFLGDNFKLGMLGRRFAVGTQQLGDGEVEIGLTQVGLEGCYYGDKRPVQVGLCGAFLGGAIRGEAFNFREVSSATHVWFGFEAGVGALWSFAPGLWLSGDLRLVAPFNDDQFVIRGVGELTPGNRIGQTAQLALGFRIE
ncbi:MAG: hypothetical protein AB7K71_28065 [Polyangiaceae bacterium]